MSQGKAGKALTAPQQAYLADQMDKVSRSFALVAPVVEDPLRDYLATAYLICRVVDNIEDCSQPFAWQQQRFAEFQVLLADPDKAPAILAQWENESWPGLSGDEAQMMGVTLGQPLWQIYAQMPERPRAVIAHWAEVMVRGMGEVMDPGRTDFFFAHDGVRLPNTADDYDRYCYYVAGTVGHMITELAIGHYGLQGATAAKLLANSEASGRALQKTNIIKDFPQDLRRGVCYLSAEWLQEVNYAPLSLAGAPRAWKEKVLENVLLEFEEAANYVLDLPRAAANFRKASLLMMLPGYQTLLLATRRHDQLFTAAHQVKISRQLMAQCVQDARRFVNNDEALRTYCREARAAFHQAISAPGMIESARG